MSRPKALTRSPLLAAAASWVLPGAGYWLIGHRQRGMVSGLTILALFVLGLLIGGIRVVETPPPVLLRPGDVAMNTPGFLSRLLSQRPWFIAQFFNGPVSFIPVAIKNRYHPAAEAAARKVIPRVLPDPNNRNPLESLERQYNVALNELIPTSHGRIFEIGTLYTAIAGMLNLLTMIDAAYRANHDELAPPEARP